MLAAWCISQDYREHSETIRSTIIVNTERLVFEFRIYLEQDAEQSDVRPAKVGRSFLRHWGDDPATLDTEDASDTSAYDRVDDRVFPEPSNVPVFDALNRPKSRTLAGRPSRSSV